MKKIMLLLTVLIELLATSPIALGDTEDEKKAQRETFKCRVIYNALPGEYIGSEPYAEDPWIETDREEYIYWYLRGLDVVDYWRGNAIDHLVESADIRNGCWKLLFCSDRVQIDGRLKCNDNLPRKVIETQRSTEQRIVTLKYLRNYIYLVTKSNIFVMVYYIQPGFEDAIRAVRPFWTNSELDSRLKFLVIPKVVNGFF